MRADFEELAAGARHFCGLTNGTARCWGYNGNGQTTVPAVTGGWQSLTAGWLHTCGSTKLTSTTLCWGYNHYGQTDVPKP